MPPSFDRCDEAMQFVRQPVSATALLLRCGDRLRELPAEPLDALETRLVLGSLPAAAHGWRFARCAGVAPPRVRRSRKKLQQPV